MEPGAAERGNGAEDSSDGGVGQAITRGRERARSRQRTVCSSGIYSRRSSCAPHVNFAQVGGEGATESGLAV